MAFLVSENHAHFVQSTFDTMVAQPVQRELLRQDFEHLSSALLLFRQMLTEVLPASSTESIRIKLPDTSDFGTIIQDLESFKVILDQALLHPAVNARIEVRGWENGSKWVEIYLGTFLAVKLIAGIAWAAAVVRKKWIESDIMSEQLRAIRTDNSTMETVAANYRKAIDEVVDREAIALRAAIFDGDNDSEYLERLKGTIKMLCDLMKRGAEVRPALMPAEEAKSLFPDYSALETITSKIIQLPEQSSSATEKK